MMASFVVYDNLMSGVAAQRLAGMTKAGSLVIDALNAGATDPDVILTDNLDSLINSGGAYTVKFTDHETGNEYPLTYTSPGRYTYNNGIRNVRVKVEAKKDNWTQGNEQMHLVAPTDPLNISSSSYIANVISDLGGIFSDDRARYYVGTIMFRRCR